MFVFPTLAQDNVHKFYILSKRIDLANLFLIHENLDTLSLRGNKDILQLIKLITYFWYTRLKCVVNCFH